jgi:hypothetical protein
LQSQPYLRYLYVWRSAIDTLMGEERRKVTYSSSGDLSVSQSDLMRNLQIMLDAVNARIASVEKKTASHRSGGAYGQLATTAPITPDQPPDANDRGYRGDPYIRRRRIP